MGICPKTEIFQFEEANLRWLEAVHTHTFVECYNTTGPSVTSLVASRWLELLGGPIIPFDPAVRKERLNAAFEALAPYLDLWQQDKANS